MRRSVPPDAWSPVSNRSLMWFIADLFPSSRIHALATAPSGKLPDGLPAWADPWLERTEYSGGDKIDRRVETGATPPNGRRDVPATSRVRRGRRRQSEGGY